MAEVRAYKVTSLNGVKPNSIVALKVPNENKFNLYVTDVNGVPYPLQDISGGGGAIQTITNTDGNITITGSNNLTINIAPSLLSVINSALQQSNIITNQTPTGNIDGVNNFFIISDIIVPDSEEVFINGLKIKKPNDYNIVGSNITLTFSPQTGENILVNYIKQ